MSWARTAVQAAAALLCTACAAPTDDIVIGSKNFTESVVLGDVLQLLLEQEGTAARHQRGLGGTRLVYNAL